MTRVEDVLEQLRQCQDNFERKVREILEGLADEELNALILKCEEEEHDFELFRYQVKDHAMQELVNRRHLLAQTVAKVIENDDDDPDDPDTKV